METIAEVHARMIRDYARTGVFQTQDVVRVLGDPSKGVTISFNEPPCYAEASRRLAAETQQQYDHRSGGFSKTQQPDRVLVQAEALKKNIEDRRTAEFMKVFNQKLDAETKRRKRT